MADDARLACEALARVGQVLEAARGVVEGDHAGLVDALARSSGLSPEGVSLALERCLELSPSDRELAALARWAARAVVPARCHVVLSANVPTGALRALAVAAAVSPRVWVRASRRDPVLAERLVEALARRAAAAEVALEVTLGEALAPEPGDEVHLYGRDETVAALAPHHDGLVLRMGSGLGLAAVSSGPDAGGDASTEAAHALALDVVLFDQRGCLSPRVALVEAEHERALAFAEALATALEGWGRRVPRGALDAETRAELRRYADTARATGELLVAGEGGASGLVGLSGLEGPAALVVPPSARVVHVARVEGLAEACALARPLARLVTIVGGQGGLADALLAASPGARAAALGEVQRPPLDGPVDLRPQRARPEPA